MSRNELVKLAIVLVGLSLLIGVVVRHEKKKKQEPKTGFEERVDQPPYMKGAN